MGKPPSQIKASILRSFIAPADSEAPKRSWLFRSFAADAVGFEDAQTFHLGAGTWRSGGNPLAFEIIDGFYAAPVQGDDVHVIRVKG